MGLATNNERMTTHKAPPPSAMMHGRKGMTMRSDTAARHRWVRASCSPRFAHGRDGKAGYGAIVAIGMLTTIALTTPPVNANPTEGEPTPIHP